MITVLKNHVSLKELNIAEFPEKVTYQKFVFSYYGENGNGAALYLSKKSLIYLFIYKK